MKVKPVIVMASQYFRILFWVNDVHFVSGNWTELFYVNLNQGSLKIFVECNL